MCEFWHMSDTSEGGSGHLEKAELARFIRAQMSMTESCMVPDWFMEVFIEIMDRFDYEVKIVFHMPKYFTC